MAKPKPQQQSKSYMMRLVADCLDAKPQHPFLWRDGGTGEYYDGLKSDIDLKHVDHVKLDYVQPLAEGAELINPDNLPADQIGVGFRLPVTGETSEVDHEMWQGSWVFVSGGSPVPFSSIPKTCRVPSKLKHARLDEDLKKYIVKRFPDVWMNLGGTWSYKAGGTWHNCKCNDPFQDLNALHELEKLLPDYFAYSKKLDKAVNICEGSLGYVALASCAERKLAITQTLPR